MNDLHEDAQLLQLLNHTLTTGATETVTSNTSGQMGAADIQGFNGVATAILNVKQDANAAAADTVAVVIQKCTAADGTGATTHASFTTQLGTGAARQASEQIRVPISGYGGLGTTYRYLRVSATITDANSSGIHQVSVVLALYGERYLPTN